MHQNHAKHIVHVIKENYLKNRPLWGGSARQKASRYIVELSCGHVVYRLKSQMSRCNGRIACEYCVAGEEQEYL